MASTRMKIAGWVGAGLIAAFMGLASRNSSDGLKDKVEHASGGKTRAAQIDEAVNGSVSEAPAATTTAQKPPAP